MKSLLLGAIALPFVLAGCGGGAAPRFEPSAFKSGVEHAYLPLVPGRLWVYDGEEDGLPRHDEVRVLDELRTVVGVPCTALRQEVVVDGVLVEVTTEWFAEDDEGNVWKFGEQSFDQEVGGDTPTADSWMAGEGGAWPWLFLSSHPSVGEVYAGFRPNGQDIVRVLSVTAEAVVAAGAFADCLEVQEEEEGSEDADIILYAPTVGRVRETSPEGWLDLTSTTGP